MKTLRILDLDHCRNFTEIRTTPQLRRLLKAELSALDACSIVLGHPQFAQDQEVLENIARGHLERLRALKPLAKKAGISQEFEKPINAKLRAIGSYLVSLVGRKFYFRSLLSRQIRLERIYQDLSPRLLSQLDSKRPFWKTHQRDLGVLLVHLDEGTSQVIQTAS